MALGDALAIFIAFSIGAEIRDIEWLKPNGVNLLLVILPIYYIIAVKDRAYSIEALSEFGESARRTLSALVQTFLLLLAILFAAQAAEEISRLAIFAVFAISLIVALFLRYLSFLWIQRSLGGVLVDELLILDGVAPPVRARYQVDAIVNGIEPNLDDPAVLERFAAVAQFYDRVLVACPLEKQRAWSIMLKTIDAKGELLVEGREDLGVIGLGTFESTNTLVVSRGSLSLADRAKKRAFDLVVSSAALVALAPLMLIVAICIKLDSRGPVFFKQPRVGRNNAPFQIYKFRSMRQEASDLAGAQSTRRDDDRISRFGGFIRKTSIDELPQILNVLKGDMSIVGPRPHALGSTAEDRLFWQISHRYWERHVLKPGITGLAQVRGYRGATVKADDLLNRLNSDLEYLSGWRLWRDIAIIFATLKVLVHPNAY